MKTNKNDTKKNTQLLIILVLVIAAIFVIISIANNNKESDETTLTETLSEKTTDISNDDTTLITGKDGENDTLIPATVNRVVNEKVVETVVDDKTIEVCMIGIQVPDEYKQRELEYLNTTLKPGTEIWLQYDENTKNEKNQDVCYIWLSSDISTYSYADCKGKMLQGILINNDMAEPLEEYPNSRYEIDFNLINKE